MDWNAAVTFTMADDNYPTWQKNGLIQLLESVIAETAELKVVNMKKCQSYDPRRPCSSGEFYPICDCLRLSM